MLMKKITIKDIKSLKRENKKFTVLTAYDFSFARVLNDTKIDIILVGDSLGNVIQGNKNTIPVTIEEMCYHTKLVAKAASHSLVMSDMPFMSYKTLDDALINATKLMQSGAEIIKIEGGKWVEKIIKELSVRGIPTCCHLGLTPQYIHKLGSYGVRGKGQDEANTIKSDSMILEKAGADFLLLECVPTLLGEEITKALEIPVVGIGAGGQTDGQVLVTHDILGLSELTPKFTKNFLTDANSIKEAIERYKEAVLSGKFPSSENCFE